uniref:Variant surface glycoprotein 1125.5055 n=1 Tax=Trypanosoma brucei TaxID=5691 RepID=A0A1J0RBN2_9TRYP|nr:variant surface glycoprotein 1125.5055 [Trypanosoma brucei]
MSSKRQAAVLAFSIAMAVLSPPAEAASSDQLENAPAFMALCQILRQCQKSFDAPQDTEATAAAAAFKGILAAEHLASTNDTYVSEKIAAEVDGLQKALKPLPQNEAGLKARHLNNETVEKARAAKKTVDDAAQAIATDTAAANALLIEAITGDGKLSDPADDGAGYFTATNAAKMFGSEANNNQNCGETGTGDGSNSRNVGITLVSDLFCLCVRGSTWNKKVCHKSATTEATGSSNYDNSASHNANAYAAFIQKCSKRLKPVTPASLGAAVAAYNSQIGALAWNISSNHDDAGYIVGYAHAGNTGCTGPDSQVCVNYKSLLEKSDATAIPWQVKIGQAIDKLPSNAVVQEIKAGTQTLAHMNLTVWQIYYSALSQTATQVDHSPKLLDSKKFEENK